MLSTVSGAAEHTGHYVRQRLEHTMLSKGHFGPGPTTTAFFFLLRDIYDDGSGAPVQIDFFPLPALLAYSHQDLSRIFQSTFSPHIVIIWVRPNWIKVGYAAAAAPERPSPNVISLIFRLNRSAPRSLPHYLYVIQLFYIQHFIPPFFFTSLF